MADGLPGPGAGAASAAVGNAVRGAARRPLAVALLAAALTAAPGACAWADDQAVANTAPGGASAVLDGLKTYGQAVLHARDGSVRRIPAGLYEMRVDGGGMLQTYGVGVAGNAQPQAHYTESGWGGSPLGGDGEAGGRIRWVLEHSYPQLNDLAGLAKAAGAGALTAESAAAGTQVAIWRLADGAQVEATDQAAEKLADYLQREAGRLPEPPASLRLDPGRASGPAAGPAGSRIGPVTVRTGAQSVSVTPDAAAVAMGVRVVDADGQPVTAAADGTRLYFEVPAGTPDGTASVTVQGSTKVPVGRVFTSGIPDEAQVVAGSSESASTATASAVWPQPPAGPVGKVGTLAGSAEVIPTGTAGPETQSPDEERLAVSGSSAATPVIASLAVGLVVLGGMVVLLLRKRPLEGEEGEGGETDG
ncbi:TQXA domain-containing protein [Streptomyces sp. NPDC006670]|uniref:TQXA domain-containing protein n=1 Tax=Streptomyces sp. NPDC006670 TaxID=3154476 RepID=UPI0033EE0E28